MRVHSEPSVEAFAHQVLPWLGRDPVRHNIAANLVSARAAGAVPVEEGALWLAVHDGDDLVGVALRTPPHPLLLTAVGPDVVAALVDWCAGHLPGLPAVGGPATASDEFARLWAERTGAELSATRGTRLFRLDAVVPPLGVPGALQQAGPGDREVVLAWVAGFFREAVPDEDVSQVPAMVDRHLDAGEVWLWEDGDGPVSMLWVDPPLLGVAKVSGVYTPPGSRGRGYASGCVAAVSQRILDDGAVCSLYTDVANPTSNKIYQAIGYVPVHDLRVWRFDGATAG
ncbi:GNAT family N-acetyltransferase [Longispora sp. NPDC051575]|uniref:GNAT family N-acetyltransferase n=1 Tax=Longispora sp. NPDC051575 TaxID=3154943 RepID=UPI0034168745